VAYVPGAQTVTRGCFRWRNRLSPAVRINMQTEGANER
jgi:hypothetical protein